MQAALDLPPRGKISPYTYHYLFGLLGATGLRIAEALALQRDDVVDDGLIIRNGKFGKQRLLPIWPSTRQALETYLAIRKKLGAGGDDLFVTIRGRTPHQVSVHSVFVRLARKLGFRGPTGTIISGQAAPSPAWKADCRCLIEKPNSLSIAIDARGGAEDDGDWRKHADTLQGVSCKSKCELTEPSKVAGRSRLMSSEPISVRAISKRV